MITPEQRENKIREAYKKSKSEWKSWEKCFDYGSFRLGYIEANTEPEDEPNHHCKDCRDSWLLSQMTLPAQKEYTKEVENQITLRKIEEIIEQVEDEYMPLCYARDILRGDWLQSEDK